MITSMEKNKPTHTNIKYVLIASAIIALVGWWIYSMSPTAWENLLGARMQDFLTLTLSVLIEAMPFVILGVSISVLIQLFLPPNWILDHLPKNIFVRRIILSVSGIALPVCECGNVPVARSLIAKGLTPAESLVFLFTAPIINPITYISTVEAFRLDPSIVAWRFAGALVIANAVASIIGYLGKSRPIITDEFSAVCESDEHHHRPTFRHGLDLFYREFWTVLRMLGLGAVIAAASQTFIPREVVTSIGSHGMLSILAMITLAFTISICSNVDAFFALTYARTFTPGSIVSFLVFGPMIDIKLLALMKTTYRPWVLATMTGSVFILSFLLGIVVNYVQ